MRKMETKRFLTAGGSSSIGLEIIKPLGEKGNKVYVGSQTKDYARINAFHAKRYIRSYTEEGICSVVTAFIKGVIVYRYSPRETNYDH